MILVVVQRRSLRLKPTAGCARLDGRRDLQGTRCFETGQPHPWNEYWFLAPAGFVIGDNCIVELTPKSHDGSPSVRVSHGYHGGMGCHGKTSVDPAVPESEPRDESMRP